MLDSGGWRLTLAEPVAESVRRNHVEHALVGIVVTLEAENLPALAKAVLLEFGIQGVEVADVKGAAVLRGISAVLGERHPHFVAREHGGLLRRTGTRDDPETEHALVERNRRVDVRDRERQRIAPISECTLERPLHAAIMPPASAPRKPGAGYFAFDMIDA